MDKQRAGTHFIKGQKGKKQKKITDRALDVGYDSNDKKAVFYFNSNDDLQEKMVNSISTINNLVKDYEDLLHQDSRKQIIGEGRNICIAYFNISLADFKEMEEFITNGYYKVQQSLTNSQQQVNELLKPLTDSEVPPGRSPFRKENINSVSRNLK